MIWEARPDSPVTMSKSCSDKIALKQCTSLLSGLAATLISPENAYIDTLILPKSQYIREACERAFGLTGRMKPMVDSQSLSGFSFRPFTVQTTELNFYFSREQALERSESVRGSNVSATWAPFFEEALINGVLQGRKQKDPKGASRLSRRMMLHIFHKSQRLALHPHAESPVSTSYSQAKNSPNSEARRLVKAKAIDTALQGWRKNAVDDFCI